MNLRLNEVLQYLRAFGVNLQNELAEESVCPSKPRAREFGWVIPFKRFVHEASSRVRRLQHLEAETNLPVVAAKLLITVRRLYISAGLSKPSLMIMQLKRLVANFRNRNT